MLKRFAFSLAAATLLYAQTPVTQDFLLTLNEVSDIASATKLNLDQTPSVVTVLDRDFIKNSGAITLLDLLRYIPGIEISMTPSGKRQIIIRGVKSSYRDKLKFLINGIEVTNDLYTNQFYYYNFPASLIKRIEFTATPDAVHYGNNAFLGVINIITLDQTNDAQLHTYITTQHGSEVTLFTKIPIKDATLTFDAYAMRSKPDLTAPMTKRIDLQTRSASSFRPAIAAHTLEKTQGVGLGVQKGNWRIQYRLQYYKKGNFFGLERVAPLRHDHYVHMQHQYFTIDYDTFFDPYWKLSTQMGIAQYIWNGSFRIVPYDAEPTTDPKKDIIFGAFIQERRYFTNNTLKYIGQQHQLQIHLDALYAKPTQQSYFQEIPSQNIVQTSRTPLQAGIQTKTWGTGIEDLFSLNERIALSGGARIDYYDTFGSKPSYKAGIVYHLAPHTTCKYLLSSAFRAPPWVEAYASATAEFHGNSHLRPEKISLHEIEFLHAFTPHDRLILNLYKGEIDDTIDRYTDPATGQRVYRNLGSYDLKGYELRYTKLWDHMRTDFFLAKTFNKRNYKRSSYDMTQYLGIRPTHIGISIDGEWQRVHWHTFYTWASAIATPPYIADIKSYSRLDQTFRFHLADVDVELGVYNLTNTKQDFFAPPSELYRGRYMFVPQYGSVPAVGRTFFIHVRKLL